MEDHESGWKQFFPLTNYITSERRTFWIATIAYLIVPVLVGIVFFIAANSLPVLALIIGLLEMPLLFYAIVAVILTLVTYRQQVQEERREEETQTGVKPKKEKKEAGKAE